MKLFDRISVFLHAMILGILLWFFTGSLWALLVMAPALVYVAVGGKHHA